MGRRTASIGLLLASALVVAGCSSDTSDEPGSTVAPAGAVSTTAAPGSAATTDTTTPPTTTPAATTTTTLAQEPAIVGAELIEQTTPESGGGTRPLLEWVAVDGAALYFVNIYTESGGPYWSAVTADTNTYVGGPLQIPAGRSGPNVAEGYTWVVYAEDVDGTLLAVSATRPIAP